MARASILLAFATSTSAGYSFAGRAPVRYALSSRRSGVPCACDAPAAATPAAAITEASLPPESFRDLIEQAADSAAAAIADGTRLIEVEFPPIPVSQLEDSSLSAYDILKSNLALAGEFAKRFVRFEGALAGKTVALMLPDLPERKRATELLGDEEPYTGVRVWSLTGGGQESSPFDFLSSVLKRTSSEITPAPWAAMYIILGASCQELPSIRKLHEMDPTVPIVCFNLKLDTLRGDLGLPAFPPKRVHHEFLSKVKPVYYMRPRTYSLSLSRPPFLISYSGVLFRRYPEGYQTLLDKGRGTYRRVNVETVRPGLGNFKAQLTSALKIDDEKAQAAISSSGFKQSTWWEDNKDGLDVSAEWRA